MPEAEKDKTGSRTDKNVLSASGISAYISLLKVSIKCSY